MHYLVKIRLNDLPWEQPDVYRNALGELERMAIETPGYVDGLGVEALYGQAHVLGMFDGLAGAQEYQGKALGKEYVGEVTIGPESPRHVMCVAPPEQLLKAPNRCVHR